MRVEKVSYNIDWKAFKRGCSFFIPCLDPYRARRDVIAPVRRLKINVVTKVTIEDGIRGIRVWRV